MTTNSRLHVRPNAPDHDGCVMHVTPEGAGWEYLGFDVYRIKVGQTIARENIGRETCAVLLSGSAEFEVDGVALGRSEHRESPFDGNVWALYAPLGSTWKITALEPLDVAVGSAPARERKEGRIISPKDVTVQKRGQGTNTRYVTDLLPEDQDVADSLLVVEAITPSGNWSSYPPHKHDSDRPPAESQLEEVYYHRIKPSSGFAMQRVYTDDRSIDETISVSDGEAVLVPRGYHPVGAPHGYDLYYLNVMAGPKRIWRTFTDPDHAWLLDR